MPSLASFAIYCYSQHSHLYYSDKSIWSATRRSFGSSVVLSNLVAYNRRDWIKNTYSYPALLLPWRWYYYWNRTTQTERGSIYIYIYIYIHILTVSGRTCGLELRTDKYEVWSKEALNTIESRIKRNSKEGLEILGATVGTPRFVFSSIQKRVQKIGKLLENLKYINDPQCALGILCSCLGAPKMVY